MCWRERGRPRAAVGQQGPVEDVWLRNHRSAQYRLDLCRTIDIWARHCGDVGPSAMNDLDIPPETPLLSRLIRHNLSFRLQLASARAPEPQGHGL